ncbi:unnamed protein product [Peniophora sp. CBMAI 1063]|nr:unnamed protein product [Peniophora sp. CBMAI 1063]
MRLLSRFRFLLRFLSALRYFFSMAPAIKEREKKEKAEKLAAQKRAAEAASSTSTPKRRVGKLPASGAATPVRRMGASIDQGALDMAGLNLQETDEPVKDEPPPKMTLAKEKVLEEARQALNGERAALSLVVIGHVDAGKSTLMGRLLYETGRIVEKERQANARESDRQGKGSFAWAWSMDATSEERARGITMDVAQNSLATPHRAITILDAPGHRDFVPNMISGAAQADCALLVVDAGPGEFEAGFAKGGQTREHVLLVRSLGVAQAVVAVNKLDAASWDQDRYNEIVETLKPFMQQSGFAPQRTHFVPVAAPTGVNLVTRDIKEAEPLKKWYDGPTLVDLLDKLQPPARDLSAPLRFPVSNVFKATGSSSGVTGRVLSGVVQVGERLRVLPGDETAVVRAIEGDDDNLPWAAAGANVTLYLTAIDPIHLNIGSVLCPPTAPVPLASTFTARIIVFDIVVPILAGSAVEIFFGAHDLPASISKLTATLDRTSGKTIKANPRVLTKGANAEVQITLRGTGTGTAARPTLVPLEPFSVNKEMGRVLVRRGGETIAAGIVLDILS